ncbi:hypothetical protein [Turneriella parva]|uniref:Uncharacterized protein n=1 Tax=Turneriella parva (strain ATCC BAA-1111 / DSM 21527 / NCTC 11395 / H) TaxID=869212 RepID=I4B6N3_TURPD|nr:hypothetical protein [Turneriella parva]AFM12940.1 hypothetical protein Turpa_2295 [Turneriella parva DSM 21527]
MLRFTGHRAAIFSICRLSFTAVVFSCLGSIWGLGASFDMPGKTPEQAVEVAKRSLARLNVNCIDQEVTLGAHWRCKTSFFSIIGLDVFVSTIPEKSIIRADSRNRQSYAFIDLVANETGQPAYEKTYGEKSLLLSTGATLISPAFGYLYVNSNSMVKNKSVFLPFLGYLFGDLALFWVSSKIWFTNGFDPFEVGLTSMLIAMGTFRAIMLVPFSIQVMAHNRFAGLQITYRF